MAARSDRIQQHTSVVDLSRRRFYERIIGHQRHMALCASWCIAILEYIRFRLRPLSCERCTCDVMADLHVVSQVTRQNFPQGLEL